VAAQQVYTINQMANDIVALLDHLKIPAAHLCGHSMGGRIALEMTLNFPGRVKSLIMAPAALGRCRAPGPIVCRDCRTGWCSAWSRKASKKALREEYCDTSAFFTDDYRSKNAQKDRSVSSAGLADPRQTLRVHSLIIARHNWEATHRLGDVKCRH
jgi:pimeloyl-ACP methyl ester carboxylesterase